MARSHEFGQVCEDLAAAALAARGWSIVARNFRYGHKEIDLIARRGATVAFIEVKGRSRTDFGHPLECIGSGKRRDVEAAARWWIVRHGRADDSYRFDAVAVTLHSGGAPVVEHVENAWSSAR